MYHNYLFSQMFPMWDMMERDSGSLFHVEPPRKDTGMEDPVLIHSMAGKLRQAVG